MHQVNSHLARRIISYKKRNNGYIQWDTIFELYLTPVKLLIRTDSKNFKYSLSAKISRQIAKGRILAWQIWFQ